jgi:hypothetical protein
MGSTSSHTPAMGLRSNDLFRISWLHALNYSSTGTAYKGGSEGKIDKGGSPVVQGQKDRSPRTRRDTHWEQGGIYPVGPL